MARHTAPRCSPPSDFPFEPRFVEVQGHRIAYVEHGHGDPVLFAEPGVIVSHANPCGHRRLDELRERLPQLQVRAFGDGFHFLSEENPDRVVEMVVQWLDELRAGALDGRRAAGGM